MLLASTTVSRGCNHGVSPAPRRDRGSYSHNSGSTLGGRAGPAPIPVIQPFPGSWRTADLQPCAPLGLIGPLGLQPRPLPRDEVAGETGAPVPMTTGALGLAFAFFGRG